MRDLSKNINQYIIETLLILSYRQSFFDEINYEILVKKLLFQLQGYPESNFRFKTENQILAVKLLRKILNN